MTIIEQIAAIVGPKGILVGEDARTRPDNWIDGSKGNLGAAIVRPNSTEELSQVMRLCHETGQPVVPHGGLTGLVQGARLSEGEIAISLERLNRVEAIDVEARTLTVQAGLTLQAAQEAAEQSGLALELDLGARGSATIGGVISTNAGGNRVIRYGMAREQVLGVEVVLADGRTLTSLNQMLKNNAGYDLKQLFIGSEGTLGIVTRAVLRLRPMALSRQTALLALNDFSTFPALLNQLDASLGGRLSAFEVMWNSFYRQVMKEGRHNPPMSDHHPYYLLIEAQGGNPQADHEEFQTVLEGFINDGLVVDATIAQSDSQIHALWAIRDDIEAVTQPVAPAMMFDISLPINHMQSYLTTLEESLKQLWPDVKFIVWGHLGDSNLHIVISTNEPLSVCRPIVEELLYNGLRPFNGSVSAEHGIGLEKREYLDISRSPVEIDLMKSIKQALDPHGILNPGKVIEISTAQPPVKELLT